MGERSTYFQGSNTLNLDAKGRMAVPAKAREQLRDHCVSSLVVTINPHDKCLWVYPDNEWSVIAGQLAALPALDRRNKTIKRLLLGSAHEVDMDSQGRILLPPALRAYANLEKKCVLAGDGKKFELWDEVAYNEQFADWLEEVGDPDSSLSDGLAQLAL